MVTLTDSESDRAVWVYMEKQYNHMATYTVALKAKPCNF